MQAGKHDLIIIGGGLAGLVAAIQSKRGGLDVLLIEKKQYPFHRVCGEYISNEVVPFLKKEGLYPEHLLPSQLQTLELSDIKGNLASLSLPLGGFGVSRYHLDLFLYEKALLHGVKVLTQTEATSVHYENDGFSVQLKGGETMYSKFVIGSYGKRAKLDKYFNRSFIKKQSPFIGIKYHAHLNYPSDRIGLYNFEGGYCGISHVEGGMVNICYLSKRDNLKKHGSIQAMEKAVLHKNPVLQKYFEEAVWIREKPEVINEISFEKKEAVINHVIMAGDTAGLITPLCGNGMAMAIHSGKIASENILAFFNGKFNSREEVEKNYKREWKKYFSKRLFIGRTTQNLFGNQFRAKLAVDLINKRPKTAKYLISQTHGEVI